MHKLLRGSLVVLAIALAAGPVRADDPSVAEVFTWKRGEPAKVLKPDGTHMCLLIGVSGRFSGGGERVSLVHQNGNWVLTGASQQSQLQASAACIAKAWFPRFASSPKTLVNRTYDMNTAGNCQGQRIQMPGYGGRRAYFISGVSGKFRGDGEKVMVVDRKYGDTLITSLLLQACSGYVGAALSSFEAHSGKPMAFINAKGEPASLQGNVRFHVISTGPSSKSAWEKFVAALPPYGIDTDGSAAIENTRNLVPVDKGICGLTFISGKFMGYGEGVEIQKRTNADGKEWWVLVSHILTEDNWIWGEARCLARQQPFEAASP